LELTKVTRKTKLTTVLIEAIVSSPEEEKEARARFRRMGINKDRTNEEPFHGTKQKRLWFVFQPVVVGAGVIREAVGADIAKDGELLESE